MRVENENGGRNGTKDLKGIPLFPLSEFGRVSFSFIAFYEHISSSTGVIYFIYADLMMDVCVGARNEHLRLYSTQTLRAHGRCLSRRFYCIISVLSFLLLMNCSSAFQVRILKRRPTSSLFLRPNKPSKPTDIDEDFLGLDVDNDNENSGESRRQSLSQNRPVLLDAKGKFTMLNKAILAGIFVAGIGTGINLDSAINTNPKDLASRDAIDRNAPNPKLCARFGSSAMVMDQRLFVTFNPFNVYVTQGNALLTLSDST